MRKFLVYIKLPRPLTKVYDLVRVHPFILKGKGFAHSASIEIIEESSFCKAIKRRLHYFEKVYGKSQITLALNSKKFSGKLSEVYGKTFYLELLHFQAFVNQ